MKRIILITYCTLAFFLSGYSLDYKVMYDNSMYNLISDTKDAHEDSFAWNLSRKMESLAIMYEETKDDEYLEVLIECCINTIDCRDDNRSPQVKDYRNVVGAVWTNDLYSTSHYAHVEHSANITLPMAKFASIVERFNLGNKIHNRNDRLNNQTYASIKDEFVSEIELTINYHEDQYTKLSNYRGYYSYRDIYYATPPLPTSYFGAVKPYNQLSCIGRLFLHMYLATNESKYHTRLVELANYINENTTLHTYYVEYYLWNHWDNPNHSYRSEDVSHAATTAIFPYECYKYGISFYGYPLYSQTDLERYANLYYGWLNGGNYKLYLNIGSRTYWWNFSTNSKYGSSTNSQWCVREWLRFSEIDDRIYSSVKSKMHATYYPYRVTSSTTDQVQLALLYIYSKYE